MIPSMKQQRRLPLSGNEIHGDPARRGVGWRAKHRRLNREEGNDNSAQTLVLMNSIARAGSTHKSKGRIMVLVQGHDQSFFSQSRQRLFYGEAINDHVGADATSADSQRSRHLAKNATNPVTLP
jgi:hypothetical protein